MISSGCDDEEKLLGVTNGENNIFCMSTATSYALGYEIFNKKIKSIKIINNTHEIDNGLAKLFTLSIRMQKDF